MASRKRALLEPTDDWQQLQFQLYWPEQTRHELAWPVMVFGARPVERAADQYLRPHDLPLVSADEQHPLSRMFVLSAIFMLLTFAVFVGYGLFAALIRNHVIARPRVLTWMRRTFAGAFVALGGKLALADR